MATRSPQKRRTVLEQLGKERLAELADRFELEVGDRPVLDEYIQSIVRSRSVEFLYDPTTGGADQRSGRDVAAWFVDHDYDERTFCLGQAFFPARATKNPWGKLEKALKGTIDEEKLEALRGTRSLPFKAGKRIAVTVIDDSGNEVRQVVEGGKA